MALCYHSWKQCHNSIRFEFALATNFSLLKAYCYRYNIFKTSYNNFLTLTRTLHPQHGLIYMHVLCTRDRTLEDNQRNLIGSAENHLHLNSAVTFKCHALYSDSKLQRCRNSSKVMLENSRKVKVTDLFDKNLFLYTASFAKHHPMSC